MSLLLAPAQALRLGLCLLAVLVTLWLGVGACRPPRPLPATAPATAFSAERALANVRAIAMRPHPVGTPEHDRVAAYLVQRLAGLGLVAEPRRYLIDDRSARRVAEWSGGVLHPAELTDVLGVLPGRDRRLPALLLMAHYDTVWGSPGAADDSAGVATAIEVARALAARGPRARDVIVLLTDGEETGLSGSRAFFGGDALASHVGLVINLETRGAGGRAVMFETGSGNGALMRTFARAVRHPQANSLAALAYAKMPNSTDFTPARQHGLPGLNFAFSGRAALYHSPLATIDRLDLGSVQDMGQQALDVVAALATAPTLPPGQADATFFDLLGRHLVRYPAGAGWWVLIAAAAILALALRRQPAAAPDVLAGAGAGVWLLAHGALALGLFNALSGAGPDANYYNRLAQLPWLEAQGWLVLLGFGLVALAYRSPALRVLGALPGLLLALFATRLGAGGAMTWALALVAMASGAAAPRSCVGGWGGWVGLVALVLLLGVGTQVAAAPAAWVFAWPALVLALAVLAAAWLGARPATLVVAAIAAIAATAPLLPLAHLGMLGLGGPLPQILLLAVVQMLAALWPLARMRFNGGLMLASALLLLAAGGVALHLRHAPVAVSVPAYSLDG